MQERRNKVEEKVRLNRAQSELKEKIRNEQKERVQMLIEKGIEAKYRSDLERMPC